MSMNVEKVRRDICGYIMQKYNINVEKKEDERLLMHEHLFKSRDLVVMVWDMCNQYGINVKDLPPYTGNVTVNEIAEYLGSIKV